LQFGVLVVEGQEVQHQAVVEEVVLPQVQPLLQNIV
jgi:hypothetical protein